MWADGLPWASDDQGPGRASRYGAVQLWALQACVSVCDECAGG